MNMVGNRAMVTFLQDCWLWQLKYVYRQDKQKKKEYKEAWDFHIQSI